MYQKIKLKLKHKNARSVNLAITEKLESICCAIMGTDTNSQCYFFHQDPNNAWYHDGHWLTGYPYVAIIGGNDA